MSGQPVLLDIDDGVADLRLNRPDASNALNEALLTALDDTIARLRSESQVRAVILRGEGRNFCAGGDVVEFAEKGDELSAYLRGLTARLQDVVRGLVSLGAPVIALVQGAATGGGGWGLICSSDFVLAGPRAKFKLGATGVGMTADGGVSVSLTRLVGLRQALRLSLENPMLSAAEALELGLISRVVEDDDSLLEVGRELAARFAAGAADAQAETKRLVWEGLGRSFEDCLADEARTVSALAGSADAREGLAAVIARRPAAFGVNREADAR